MVTLSAISIGTLPNDGTGDSLRHSFQKCNANNQVLDALTTVVSSNSATTWGNRTHDVNQYSGHTVTLPINFDVALLTDTTGNNSTITLPDLTSAGVINNMVHFIKSAHWLGGTYNPISATISIEPYGTQEIDGSSSYTISKSTGSVQLLNSDGDWYVLSTA